MGDTTNRLAGVCTFTVDGVNYMMAGDFSYKLSGVSRETLKGQDGVHGYKEQIEQGYIGGTIRDAGGVSMADLNGMSNVTLVLQLANGKTVIGRNMWRTENPENKTTEATIDLKWEGPSVTEN